MAPNLGIGRQALLKKGLYSTYTQGRLTAFDHVVLQKNAEKPQFKKYKFSLQIYSADEIRKMLNKHGFDVLEQRDFMEPTFDKEKTPNFLTVAQKI